MSALDAYVVVFGSGAGSNIFTAGSRITLFRPVLSVALPLDNLEVRTDHLPYQVLEARTVGPSQVALRLGWVSK